MLQPFVAVLLGFFFCLSLARAETVPLPGEDRAAATIEMPDAWEPEEIAHGFAATSPDRAIYLAAVAVDGDVGARAEVEEIFAMLKGQNVVLEQTAKTEEKFQLNGREASAITYPGRDEDGPVVIRIVTVPADGRVIVITSWISTAEEKEHRDELAGILGSLRIGTQLVCSP